MQKSMLHASIVTIAMVVSFSAVASTEEWTGELKSASYMKVMENSGSLVGNWSLAGAKAWDGEDLGVFTVVSNRPYDSGVVADGSAERGDMPVGPYVCRLSVLNRWNGSRTCSYRIMLAQPVGSYDIYARVTAVTISAEGVNLASHPDIRQLVGTDAIEFAYTGSNPDDLARFPIVQLKFRRQDGYIESNGSLDFNTGYCVGPNTKLELDFQLTNLDEEAALGKCLMAIESPNDTGSSYATTLPRFLFYLGKNDDKLKLTLKGSKANGDVQAYNLYDADLDRHTAIIDIPASTDHFKVVTEGEQDYASGNRFSEFLQKSATIPLGLFGQTRCGPSGFPNRPATGYDFVDKSQMKVFGFRVYEKQENGSYKLMRNFVPCLKGGVYGFNEECSGTFFTGGNVSTVGYGGDIEEVEDDPYISTGDYNDVTTAAAAGKCLYLDTGYYFKTTSRVELDFTPLTPNSWTSGTKYNHAPEFMYARSYNPNYELEVVGRNSSTGNIGVKIGNSDYRDILPLSTAYNIRRKLSVDAYSVTITTSGCTNYENRITTPGYGILADLTTTLKLGSSLGTGNDFAPMKIYGLKIYESDVLVKDYRPTVTNGVPGLIDVKDPTAAPLFATTYGASVPRLTFTPGGAIACTDGSNEAYLDFYDGVKIDTGYVITKDSCIEAEFSVRDPNDGRAQYFLVQEPPNNGSSVGVYLYLRTDTSPQTFAYKFENCSNYNGTPTVIPAAHDRTYFKFDGPNKWMTIVRGGNVLASQQTAGTLSVSGGSTTLKLGGSKCTMRLYRFKVSQNGVLTSDFVPAKVNGVAGLYDRVKGEFLEPTGGTLKMSGKGANGIDDFLTTPQPMLVETESSGTLKCLATGAQSYEWYRDGEKIDGGAGGALTVDWIRGKPYTRTYSVVPVYTVFSETVRGEPAEAKVDFRPLGMAIIIK